MPKTTIKCPNCRQPITADIEQLFDAGADPSAKQRLLSGAFNMAQCPHCGYAGNLATPIVYHDPDKELLLTFIPPEVGLSRDDQERLIGSMINQVVNRLPQEKRKGYLLRPQSVLTAQGLAERILEADGVTKEMLQASQQRLSLLQRLVTAAPDVRTEIAQSEDELIDAEFFALLARLGEAAAMSGDENSAGQLAELQKSLLPVTTYGRQIMEQAKEMEAAANSLQELGEGLTREKLLDLVIKAPNDTRLSALVSLARAGMDYSFFQMLTERIDRARADGRARLVELRERLLNLTRDYDQQVEARTAASRQLLDSILAAEDIEQAVMQNLPAIDDFFLQSLSRALEAARGGSDLERSAKLKQIGEILNRLSTPPEIAFLEELIQFDDEGGLRQAMEANRDQITPEFLDAVTNIMARLDNGENQEIAQRVKRVHRLALRMSMEAQLRK